jgi:anaerobic ribonucleoside-triphosphate reductase activating protein
MRFSKIKDNDIANGVGITMSLWTQGCPHHCKGCFNVETWDFNGGKEFTNSDLKYILDNKQHKKKLSYIRRRASLPSKC